MIDVVSGQTEEIGTMAVQFSGSRSAGDRRRRRLVVNGEGTGLESTLPEGDASEMESQLVASEAAGPWVPATEMRIWIYTAAIGIALGFLTYALYQPILFHDAVAPLTNHLLIGYRPVLVVGAQTVFLALAAQMGMLISWYRARCRLDFGGRYRIWPWAAGSLGLAAFCSATETHRAFATAVSRTQWLPWRGTTVAWLLPFCLAALPITLWVDRDMRNSRSSLFTFRISLVLGVVWACFEIYQPELKTQAWFNFAELIVPLFASATLFVSLWHHARVVAYVSPDPPELNERSAWSLLLGLGEIVWRWVPTWTWSRNSNDDDEDEAAKPRRRRKKTEPESAPAKRKRRAPVKKPTTTTRSRVKPVEEEEEQVTTPSNVGDEESEVEEQPVNNASDQAAWDEDPNQWNAKPSVAASPAKSKGDGRNLFVDDGHRSSVPAPHARRTQKSWVDDSSQEDDSDASTTETEDESYDDQQYQSSSGLTADQFKGLSKRQKRELKKQMRDQERSRGR